MGNNNQRGIQIMASFTIGNIRQPPEIWIMQTVLRRRTPVTTAEFTTQYKYKTEGDALKVLQTLHANRRLRRTTNEDGSFAWSHR